MPASRTWTDLTAATHPNRWPFRHFFLGGLAFALVAVGEMQAIEQLTFSWQDNSENETGFRVERSGDGTTFASIATLPADRTHYVDGNVEAGKRYWYRVAAFNVGGDSHFSPVVDGVATAVAAAENTPPTITALADRTVALGSVVPAFTFAIDDAESASEELTLIGNTSNRDLVPVGNLQFSGSGATRTLTVTPMANRTGWSTIWVKVSDGELTAVTSFVLVVAAANSVGPKACLLNLSARGFAHPDNPVIVGFVVTGAAHKQVLVRAIGPTLGLAPFSVSSVLGDPRLSLSRWTGSGYHELAANADWDAGPEAGGLQAAAARLLAFDLSEQSRDAALLLELPSGQYTAVAAGESNSAGVELVEVYDADEAASARLINLSTRGHVGTGDSVLVCGFVVSGAGTIDVLIRAVGPGLGAAPFLVAETLMDPEIELFRQGADGSSVAIFRQDDWATAAGAAETAQVAATLGAFALRDDSKDAAAVLTLGPGVYTAVVRGVNGTTGTALAELYEVR